MSKGGRQKPFSKIDPCYPKGIITSRVYSYKGEEHDITYRYEAIADSGTFGVVYKILMNGKRFAVKKVLQDPRYRNRELEIMSKLDHKNIIALLYYYIQDHNSETYLYMFMDYLPTNIANIIFKNTKISLAITPMEIKLYMYQLFSALHYLHSLGILHRDIKPANLLVDPSTKMLKLCDFGNAKKMESDTLSVAYICSRYYRAPELIFGAVHYTSAIDVWSAGCVLAECFLVGPLFKGSCREDQLVRVINVLGTPNKADLLSMKAKNKFGMLGDFARTDFLKITNFGINSDVVPLLESIFQYNPMTRPTAKDVCSGIYFSSLFNENNYYLPILDKLL